MSRMNGITMKLCIAVMVAAQLTSKFLFPSAAEEEKKVLRVAFTQSEGYTMNAPDGHRYGMIVDFLDEIAKYTGWEYEYVDTSNDAILDEFMAGKFDLMGGTYYSEGFEEYFAYPDYSCGYSKLILLARRDDNRIKSYDLNTFQGMTIGVYERNVENIRRLKEYMKINGLECELKYYSYEQVDLENGLTRYLKDGEVDLVLGNSSDNGSDCYIAAAFDSQPHYIVTNPGNQEILDDLNMALEQIYEANPNFAKDLYEAHFPISVGGYARLNEKEREYIAGKKTVSVAVPMDWHPMFCMSNADTHNGLVPDVLNEVSDYSGLEFSYRYYGNYVDALRGMQSGEAEVLGFFDGTNEDAVARGLALTTPYAQLSSILVRNKNASYPSEGLVGAVLEGRELPDGIVADRVLFYPDVTSALRDVNRGKADFFYGVSSHLEYIIQQERLTNVVQVNLVNNQLDISFALAKPAQPELLTIINKGINNLTEEKKASINSRNLVSIGESHMTLASIVYANPGLAVSVVAMLLVLALFVVILAARNRVNAAVMQGELEKAEADSRAKGEFLSRMSHELRTPMNAIVGLTDLTCMVEGLPGPAKENLSKLKTSSHYLLRLINDILDMSRIENGRMEMAREAFSMGAMLDEVKSMMASEAAARGIDFRLEKAMRDDVLIGDGIRLRQVILNLLSNAFKFTPAGGSVLARATQGPEEGDRASITVQVIDTGVGIGDEDQQRIFHSFEQLGPNITKSQGTGLGLTISRVIVQMMGGELKVKSQPGEGSEFYFHITLEKGRLEDGSDGNPEGQTEHMLQGTRILIAEDNDLNAEIAVELLKAQGALTERAADGKTALELFEGSGPGAYQAILMDVQMPRMNGLEATRAIRLLPRQDAREIPIIAMTANTFQEDVEAAFAAGMSGFISKPVDASHLFEELENALKRPRRTK